MKKIEIDYNKIYSNKYNQKFKILNEIESRNGARWVRIKFIKTGYETNTKLYKALDPNNEIHDYLTPSVCGVGCLGYATHINNEKMYNVWQKMIARCYDTNNPKYNTYGAIGTHVCQRWLRFDQFLEDAIKLPGYEDMINNPDIKYQIDKDILQQGCKIKIYSPNTCMWVPAIVNISQKVIDNKFNSKSTYYGVEERYDGYRVRINNNGNTHYIGVFSNIIAAANAFNYWAEYYGNPLYNDVPYMNREEWSKYLVCKINMVKYNDKYTGVRILPSGSYQSIINLNTKQVSLGVYTNKEAAANVYNYFAQINDNPNRNNVPYMSPQECRQYMVKPRVMCTIVN